MTETSRREDYAGFVDYCAGIYRISVDRNMDLGWAYSTIRHILHDLKPIYSGYTSLKAIKKFNGLTTLMTREHYNGRANSSAKILDMIESRASKEELFEYVIESCKVHYTTYDENIALVPYQNDNNYTWQEAYAKVGIKLVRYDGIKNWYKVNGIKYYMGQKELCELLDVNLYQLNKIIEDQGKEIVIL